MSANAKRAIMATTVDSLDCALRVMLVSTQARTRRIVTVRYLALCVIQAQAVAATVTEEWNLGPSCQAHSTATRRVVACQAVNLRAHNANCVLPGITKVMVTTTASVPLQIAYESVDLETWLLRVWCAATGRWTASVSEVSRWLQLFSGKTLASNILIS